MELRGYLINLWGGGRGGFFEEKLSFEFGSAF